MIPHCQNSSLRPHICINKLAIIGSDNGLSPGQCQAIFWASAGILLIRPLGTNFNWKSCIFIRKNPFENVVWRMATILSRPLEDMDTTTKLNQSTTKHKLCVQCLGRNLSFPMRMTWRSSCVCVSSKLGIYLTFVIVIPHVKMITFDRDARKLDYIDGLVLERCNSSALAMELRLSCTNPSIPCLLTANR